MMPDLGPHAAFIVASYAVMALCIGGLAVWASGDERRQRARLAALEAQGVTRRSARR